MGVGAGWRAAGGQGGNVQASSWMCRGAFRPRCSPPHAGSLPSVAAPHAHQAGHGGVQLAVQVLAPVVGQADGLRLLGGVRKEALAGQGVEARCAGGQQRGHRARGGEGESVNGALQTNVKPRAAQPGCHECTRAGRAAPPARRGSRRRRSPAACGWPSPAAAPAAGRPAPAGARRRGASAPAARGKRLQERSAIRTGHA